MSSQCLDVSGPKFIWHLLATRHSTLVAPGARGAPEGCSIRCAVVNMLDELRVLSPFDVADAHENWFDAALDRKLAVRADAVCHAINGPQNDSIRGESHVAETSVKWLLLQNFVEQAAGFMFGGPGALAFLAAACSSVCSLPCPPSDS